MSRVFLGEFEQLLLFAVLRLGDQAYGVTIRRYLETHADRSVSPGAIYTALERLERRGFVSSRLGDPTPERGGKRKRYYRIAPDGARALARSQQRLRRMARGLTSTPELR